MKILVAEGQHEASYFRFTSPEEQLVSALALFKQNDESEFYYDIFDGSEFDDEAKKIQELGAEIVRAEAAEISAEYVDKLKKRKRSMELDLKENRMQHDLYVKAKSGDPHAAMKLLKLRQDAEYEGFKIVEVK